MNFIKKLVPRLVLAGLFAVLMLIAAHPLLKHSIVRTGQTLMGTRFSVDRMRSSYAGGYLELHGCQAGHPFRPMHNLFDAKVMRFDFDHDALKRGQFVVPRATVDGLRLGLRRDSSGFLDEQQPQRYLAQLEADFEQSGQEWLDRANRQLEQERTLDFASMALLTELLEQLPVQLSEVDKRSEQMATRVQALSARLDEAGENPLRNLEDYVKVIADAEEVSRTIRELRGELGRLEQQSFMDVDRLATLKQQDLSDLPRRAEVLGLDGDQLSQYLLGPEVSEWIGEAVGWVHWGRYFFPTLAESSWGGQRGERVWFRGLEPRASLIIDKMVLRGAIPHDGGDVSFVGRVASLTSNPEISGGTTELVVQTTTDAPLLVQAKLAHLQDGEDEILVNLPNHPRPSRSLGNEHQFAIGVDPSSTHVWMKLTIKGESLSGQLVLKEKPERLSMVTRARPYGSDLSTAMNRALADVDRIDLKVELSGTLDHPQWSIESNLGPQLAMSLRAAVQSQLVERQRQRLETQLGRLTPELEKLHRRMQTVKQVVHQRLELGSREIDKLQHDIATRVEHSDSVIDPDSPLREVFRR